jgi:hypothetical protein
LLVDESTGKIARELWWMKQEFSSVGVIPPWFSMLSHKGPEQAGIQKASDVSWVTTDCHG